MFLVLRNVWPENDSCCWRSWLEKQCCIVDVVVVRKSNGGQVKSLAELNLKLGTRTETYSINLSSPLDLDLKQQAHARELDAVTYNMRSTITSLLALCLVGLASALSSTGSRLLVILDDVEDKDKYSKFWGDLQGQYCQL